MADNPSFAQRFARVYRDFNLDGVPASGASEPEKAAIRSIGAALDLALAAAAVGDLEEAMALLQPIADEATAARDELLPMLNLFEIEADRFYRGKRVARAVADSEMRGGFVITEDGQLYVKLPLAADGPNGVTVTEGDDGFYRIGLGVVDGELPLGDRASIVTTGTRFYRGKRVDWALSDNVLRGAIIVTEDGAVYVPNFQPGAVLLSQIADIVDAKVASALADALADVRVVQTAFDALAQAATRRIDFVMMNDSNGLYGGYGFVGGFVKALSARFGMYASGIFSPIGNSNQGAANLSGWNFGAHVDPGSALLNSFNMAPQQYAFVAAGETLNPGGANGLMLKVSAGVDVNARWRCHYAYGTFASGSGQFRPGARRESAPYTSVALQPTIQTNAGAEGYVLASYDIPAAVRNYDISFKWAMPGSTPSNITGPWLGYFMRAENLDAAHGISAHVLYSAGGQSLWDMNDFLWSANRDHLANYFAEIRRLQVSAGLKPIIVVYINSGLNDRNETSTPSWGWRGSDDADSANAYIDNTEAIIKRLRDLFEYKGWSPDELFFLIMPSHPVSTPDDAELVLYRRAAAATAQGRQISFVDLTNLTSATEMAAMGWYQSGGADTNHLTQAAYDALAARVVALIPEA